MSDEKSVWLYRNTESGLWTVGFFCPNGKWEPESDHDSEVSAANHVHYLNGGPQKTVAQKSSRDWTEMLNMHAGKIQKENAEIEARVGEKIPKMIDNAFSETVGDEKSVEDWAELEPSIIEMYDCMWVDSRGSKKISSHKAAALIRRIQAAARRKALLGEFEVERNKIYKRQEDMSPDGMLDVLVEKDGDVIVTIWPEGWTKGNMDYCSVQFCTCSAGGGRSPNTLAALRLLARAINADNIAQPTGEGGEGQDKKPCQYCSGTKLLEQCDNGVTWDEPCRHCSDQPTEEGMYNVPRSDGDDRAKTDHTQPENPGGTQ